MVDYAPSRIPMASIKCRCSSGGSGSSSSVDAAKPAGGDLFSVTSSSKSDVDYLGESTKGDLNLKLDFLQAFGISSTSFCSY